MGEMYGVQMVPLCFMISLVKPGWVLMMLYCPLHGVIEFNGAVKVIMMRERERERERERAVSYTHLDVYKRQVVM